MGIPIDSTYNPGHTMRDVRSSEQAYADARSVAIETLHGWFDYSRPRFDVFDIASALGMKCRFGGHCTRFYSVAEHAVLVSRLMEELGGDPREGLHHDDEEAYGPDILSPQKQLFPDVQRYNQFVGLKLREHHRLPSFKTPQCKGADNVAVLIEAFSVMTSRGEGVHWEAMDPWRDDAHRLSRRPEFHIWGFDPETARQQYLKRYQELTP